MPDSGLVRQRWLDFAGLDALLLAISCTHVLITPFTKVEESFNTQAVHDILYHGWDLSKYDHLEFPGVVPRTFIGAIVLSVLASPVALVFKLLGIRKIATLYAVRMALGGLLVASLAKFRRQAEAKFGREASVAFSLVVASQFHLLFYCSRPLPNTFALFLVILAYSFYLEQRAYPTLRLLVVAMFVFRCDVVLLLGPIGLQLLLTRSISFWAAFRCCLITALSALAVTVAVDSLMWRRLVWPEGEVLWFNTALNKSSEWGVSPFHWYFTSALPRSLLGSLPLALVGVALDRRLVRFVAPIILFILLYSKLPHKELRFIFPALPMLDLAAAVVLARMLINRKKPRWILLTGLGATSILASCVATLVLSAASHANYPGGHAMNRLHTLSGGAGDLRSSRFVHVGVLPAMTGVSRFCELEPPWRYSKEEDIPIHDLALRNFTHLLSAEKEVPGFRCAAQVSGFSRLSFNRHSFPPLQLVVEPKVFVHVQEGSLFDDSNDAHARVPNEASS